MRDSVDAYGQTTVMVTHDPRAASIADRILFIADGLIVKELVGGSPAEVLAVMGEISSDDRVALKGLARRKLRAALTAVAIVLGVAMISGTYILTDTIKSAFGTVFTEVYKHTDVVITRKSAISEDEGEEGEREAGRARRSPNRCSRGAGAARAWPKRRAASKSRVQLVGRNGKVIATRRRPGPRLQRPAHGNQRFNPLELVTGAWPSGPEKSRSTPTPPNATTTRSAKRSA